MKKVLLFTTLLISTLGFSQEISNVQLKMYGHVQYNLDDMGKANNSYFAEGEQDFLLLQTLVIK